MIQTYRIIGSTLAIPGVPGMWHAGQEVDIDADTNTILDIRLLPTTPEDADTTETAPQQAMIIHVSLDDKPIGTWTNAYAGNLPVAAEEATDTIDERNLE